MAKEIIETTTAEGSAVISAYNDAIADESDIPQQLFARIKKTSKYYGQGTAGEAFPVFAAPDRAGYHLRGGPGGRYRFADVNLYVVFDGSVLRLR